ncbi:hypothetical protein GBO60_06015 [Pediococcus acidilactici]|uniref:hypothetical protein n=1 Tax=Pediococcus acidilactici TaxID=1254 RepID=UPI001326FAA2|nr:hypothetical protein [Pediococcus acidilactici]KAF0370747.1 hypothetical protein GBO60_06015 [Pediococcus acidilactici]KAF0389545.1 hypothetical protein GBO67_06015 [Pediococcus acidilactici]
MNKKQNISLTPENVDRLTLILDYLKSDRYPINVGYISTNKAINLAIQTFYNLFVETEEGLPKTFNQSMSLYQRVRDQKEDSAISKLNRIDDLIVQNKYLLMQIFKNVTFDSAEKIESMESVIIPDTFENKVQRFVKNQVKQDKNRLYNLKHK